MATQIQPAVFIGHGSPMNALGERETKQASPTPQASSFVRSMRDLGDRLRARQPRAAIVFSAHWETDGLQVLAAERPRTIHDFYGFPRELFEISYPAPGEPKLAAKVLELLQYEDAISTVHWGLDHGVWAVMRHLWPDANLPIVMVSLARRLDPETHFRIGRLLKPLRADGVLILGSGNIVHNLKEMDRVTDSSPYQWALEFDTRIKQALEERNEALLISASRASDLAARKSVPTREHYLPLMPVLGATDPEEKPEFLMEEIQNGSISMRSVVYGL
ncbi:MAG: 4,5-DOPA dioxygenase extradiol [Bdellovibrionales bacterium]|jgi:4,5-DOPA dioxygenase extradiol|nr:4,5-DOPA dioxygenase extradiol [Bdellovibrionales bacterium]